MYVYADQPLLFVLSTLIHKQWRLAQISVYPHVFWSWWLHQIAFRHQQFKIWQASMYSLVSFSVFFLQFQLFRETAKNWNLHHFLSMSHIVFFWVLKIKINLVKLTFQTAISSHQVMSFILNNVSYGKYTTLNMVLLLHLIGLKLKEVGRSWAKVKYWFVGYDNKRLMLLKTKVVSCIPIITISPLTMCTATSMAI